MKNGLLLLLILCGSIAYAHDEECSPIKNPTPWSTRAKTQPAPDPSRPSKVYGFYSSGCVLNPRQVPKTGKYWEFVNIDRERNYGHPDAEKFLEQLGQWSTEKAGYGKLIVGDIGQRSGGPLPFGHASHQAGLDIDIRFEFFDKNKTMADAARKCWKERDVADHYGLFDGQEFALKSKLTPVWKDEYGKMVGEAAANDRVDRIFVSPPIKKWMCKYYGPGGEAGNKTYPGWLLRVSPYYGHSSHFHVRLKCPAVSEGETKTCTTQSPPGAHESDSTRVGCDGKSFGNWFDESGSPDSFLRDYINGELAAKKRKTLSPEELKKLEAREAEEAKAAKAKKEKTWPFPKECTEMITPSTGKKTEKSAVSATKQIQCNSAVL